MTDNSVDENSNNGSTGGSSLSGKISFKARPISLKQSQVKTDPSKRQVPSASLFQDEDKSTASSNARQLVTGFDKTSGAILHASEVKHEPKKEYIIPAVPNKDWRNETTVNKTPIKQLKGEFLDPKDSDGETKLTFGLNILPTREKLSHDSVSKKPVDNLAEEDDEEMIIPITEQEAYTQDIATRPDAPDLEAYNRMPVEEFGAALLRGMGWKGDLDDTDKEKSEKIDNNVKRAALLGLGAKEVTEEPVSELGAWGASAKRPKSNRPERSYVPLVKVSKSTGKVIDDAKEKRSSREPEIQGDSGRSKGGEASERASENLVRYARSDRDLDKASRNSDRLDRYERSVDKYKGRGRSDRYESGRDRPDRHSSDRGRPDRDRPDKHRSDRPRSDRDRLDRDRSDLHRSDRYGFDKYDLRDKDREYSRSHNSSRHSTSRSSHKRRSEEPAYQDRDWKHQRTST